VGTVWRRLRDRRGSNLIYGRYFSECKTVFSWSNGGICKNDDTRCFVTFGMTLPRGTQDKDSVEFS